MSSPNPPSEGPGQDEPQRPAAPDQSAGTPPSDEPSAAGQSSWSQPSTQSPAQPYGQSQSQPAPASNPQTGGHPPPPPPYGSQQPPAYGQQPPAYGQQPPPTYGQQPPPYGQQPPPPPPAYGQQQPGQYPADPDPYGQQQAPAPWTAAGQADYAAAPYAEAPLANPYASWGQRAGAYLLDALLVLPFVIVGAILYGIGIAKSTSTIHYDANGYPVTSTSGGGIALAWIGLLIYVVGLIGMTAWNRWYKAGKTGQSWGNKVMGLKLVRASDGQTIGFGMAFVRDLAHIVDSLICYVGWFFPLWDQKRQTIADKIVSTVVYPGMPKS